MAIEIKVPALPESIADATVSKWYKKPGDAVKRDENLVDLETDKVVLEVQAPADGVLKEISKDQGSKVVAHEVIGIVEAGAAAQTSTAEKRIAEKTTAPETTQKIASAQMSELGPAARRAAAEHEVDVKQISGTGKEGRITREDVISFVSKAPAQTETTKVQPVMQFTGDRLEQRVPMSRLRIRIAERLVSAQQNAAILTTFNEINLQAVMDLRARYKDQFEKAHGVRLGFMSFFTKATVEALKRFPIVNASIDGTDTIYHGYYDIGVAVSTDRGLVVPVLRNAEQMSLAGIEKQVAEYGNKAKNNQLTLEEMTGGTFTITNGGVFGSLLSTPIINPPQTAILGMHKIEERPVVEKGQIVIRPMMYVALSYDHRLIDGRDSVRFLVTIKEFLEDPSRLLLEI
jgi:2-oxoglutarate dehydrogenase E2 component (dihydrolipoamide succinyltransferase)